MLAKFVELHSGYYVFSPIFQVVAFVYCPRQTTSTTEMLPGECIQTTLEYLRRQDLESLELANRQFSRFVVTNFENSIPRRVRFVIMTCSWATITLLDESASGNMAKAFDVPLDVLEDLLRHSVVELLHFHSDMCECMLTRLCSMKERLRYARENFSPKT